MPELLFEIGTEELPAAYLASAIDQLPALLDACLREVRLLASDRPEGDGIAVTGTPRRLAMAVRDLRERQPDEQVEVSGPPERAAFDKDGNPTKALTGFARGQGLDASAVELRDTPKGRYCFVSKQVEGRPATEVLPEVLTALIDAIAFPKSMYWRPGKRRFARPVRSLLALLGEDTVTVEWNGLSAGRHSHGHPFMAPGAIEIASADFGAYRRSLRDARVVLDHVERRRQVESGLALITASHGSANGRPALVEEVADLVEWPHVQEAGFDERFLDLPRAVLEAAMTGHQRYFPLENADGELVARFAFVSNRGAEQADLVREGNERVLAARLHDASFFFRQDLKRKLRDFASELDGVVFQEKLGSYRDKVERLKQLGLWIAERAFGDALSRQHVEDACELCKADLLTEMVGEFPELQGIVGREYATRNGEAPEVAAALSEHYQPRGADDALPESPAGVCLSLAEKLDNLAGAFAVGQRPSGSKDPWALRRQAAAVVRILEERDLGGLSLEEAVAEAFAALSAQGAPKDTDASSLDEARGAVMEFLRDRLYHAALTRDARHDHVDAVLAVGYADVPDLWQRLDALASLSSEEEFDALLEVAERTFNITKKLDDDGRSLDAGKLTDKAELALHKALLDHGPEIEKLLNERRYVDAARRYREVFAAPVHQFFEDVFVMVEDADLRRARQLLCRSVSQLLATRFAHLAKVVRADAS